MSGFPSNEPHDECSNCVSLKCYRTCADTYAPTEKTVPTVSKTTAFTVSVCAAQQNEYDNATGCWISTESMLQTAAKMNSDAEVIMKSKSSNKKAYVASSASKDSDVSCCNCVSLKCYRACVDTYCKTSSRFHARFAVLDQVFVPDTTTSIFR